MIFLRTETTRVGHSAAAGWVFGFVMQFNPAFAACRGAPKGKLRKPAMDKRQKGFTIIELVVVIVILGILAAVAFPKFQDLSSTAKTAARDNAIASFKSAAVITLGKNAGAVPTANSVRAQIIPDAAFTYTGSCPTITLVYNPDTTFNSTFTIDTSLCNG
jgi:prepilin-type N-terminal cleavage/methylation domain-containing protein